MATLWKVGTSNAFNTTLNGNVGAADTSIVLTAATGLQAPGVLVIDRQDVNNVDTPTKREYISYTGISTNTLTGVTRSLGGSTGQTHSSGAKVEEVFTVTHWNDLITILLGIFTSGGVIDTTKIADVSTAQTLTNKTLSGPTLSGTVAGASTFSGVTTFKSTVRTIVTDSWASTMTLDMSQGQIHIITLGGGATTLNVSNVSAGQSFIVHLKQDAAGNRSVSWWNNIIWTQTTIPTLTATPNKVDSFGFQYDGTNYYGYIVGQNLG